MLDWLSPTEEMLAGLYAGREEMQNVIEQRDEEIKKLRDALEQSSKQLKIAMTGYRREANRMPNYDLAESTLWEMFNEALEKSTEALKESE